MRSVNEVTLHLWYDRNAEKICGNLKGKKKTATTTTTTGAATTSTEDVHWIVIYLVNSVIRPFNSSARLNKNGRNGR